MAFLHCPGILGVSNFVVSPNKNVYIVFFHSLLPFSLGPVYKFEGVVHSLRESWLNCLTN